MFTLGFEKTANQRMHDKIIDLVGEPKKPSKSVWKYAKHLQSFADKHKLALYLKHSQGHGIWVTPKKDGTGRQNISKV